MSTLRRSFSASIVYLIYSGASSLFFALIFTVNLVYQLEVAKLSPLQLVLVGTALEIVAFVSDADWYPCRTCAPLHEHKQSACYHASLVRRQCPECVVHSRLCTRRELLSRGCGLSQLRCFAQCKRTALHHMAHTKH